MPWVDNRENEILGIMSGLHSLTLSSYSPQVITLDRNTVGKLVPDQLPAILLFEGSDNIESQSGTGISGSQKRILSLAFELWVYSDSNDLSIARLNLRTLYNDVRKNAVGKRPLIEKSLTRVFTSAVPGVLGVGILTELKYINNGN